MANLSPPVCAGMNEEMESPSVGQTVVTEGPRLVSWRRAVVELAVLSLLMASPFLGINLTMHLAHGKIPYVQCSMWVFCLLATIFLIFNGGLRRVGFSLWCSWKGFAMRSVLAVALAFLLLFTTNAMGRLASSMGLLGGNTSAIAAAARPDPVFWFLVVFPLGAFLEELFFRGYLIQRFEAVFGNYRFSTLPAVIISALFFGVSHHDAGPSVVVTSAVGGLLYALIYLGAGRNIWMVSVVHYLHNAILLWILSYT